MNYQLKKKIFIRGGICLLTGLRIGGSSSAMSIGGIDNIIIRNPIDNKPYIPGSSLKGKMRTLIELRDGTIGNKKMGHVEHGPSEDSNSLSCRLFGNSKGDEQQHPSRLIVRDCQLLTPDDVFRNTDVPYAEVKTEVVIDRITSAANPRPMERVPAGAKFSLELIINIYNKHNDEEEKELVQTTFEALLLIEDDYLGGCGSRGYGQVKFYIDSVKQRTNDYYKVLDGYDESDYNQVDVPERLKMKIENYK
ncbi:MAG: type III-A CRISPR-associated RAMP protein Csm3 [Thermoflavifilum sp.]|nr:type III-A CRISPR-associated RAMP protein Csm3 [Thermoflavifilum sp.]